VAEETALGRRIAIKVLDVGLSGAVDVERFRREVAVAARLQHPHIVPVLTAGEAGGMLYYTMPYIQGESLRARLARGVPLPMFEIVCVIRDVARALACAHRQGIRARGRQAENVLVHEGGDASSPTSASQALSASTNMMCTAAASCSAHPPTSRPSRRCASRRPIIAPISTARPRGVRAARGVHPFAGRFSGAGRRPHGRVADAVGRHRPDAPGGSPRW
jgi:serine/threonine-protein kinase